MQDAILMDDHQHEEFHFVQKEKRCDLTRILLSLILVTGLVVGGYAVFFKPENAQSSGEPFLGSTEAMAFGWKCAIHQTMNDGADCKSNTGGSFLDLGCPIGYELDHLLRVSPRKHIDKDAVMEACTNVWDTTSNGCRLTVLDLWSDAPLTPTGTEDPLPEDGSPEAEEALELERRHGVTVKYFCRASTTPNEPMLSSTLACNSCHLNPEISDYVLCKTCRKPVDNDMTIKCPADKPSLKIISVEVGRHHDGDTLAKVWQSCTSQWKTEEGVTPSCTVNIDMIADVPEESEEWGPDSMDEEGGPLERPPKYDPMFNPPRPGFPPHAPWEKKAEIHYLCEAVQC